MSISKPFAGAIIAVNSVAATGGVPRKNLPWKLCRPWAGRALPLWASTPSSCSAGQGVLFNGHVFDPESLARELSASSCDQGALFLSAYRTWGEDFPKRVHGEYSFAAWDETAVRLVLGRDPSASYPLFYAYEGGCFFFATRLDLLLSLMHTSVRLNEEHIAHWLAVTSTSRYTTFFENIFAVPPGCTVCYQGNRVHVTSFWEPEHTPILRLRDPREYAHGLRHMLQTAVAARLQAHARAGTMLSGGLDSASVTATAAELLAQDERRLCAFTAVPREKVADIAGRFGDEGPNAAAVAAMYPNVDHVTVSHGRHSVFDLIDCFSGAALEPIFNPPNFDWLYEMCIIARQRDVDTLFTGEAGNLTISYAGMDTLSELARSFRWIAAVRVALEVHRQGTMRWRGVAHSLLRPLLPANVVLALDHSLHRPSATNIYSMIHPDFAKMHGIGAAALDQFTRGMDSVSLRVKVLRRADVGPIREAFRELAGVSMTDPTMDPRVVEYCLSVPVEQFVQNGIPRALIRNAMTGRLPEQVRNEQRRELQAADFGYHFAKERQVAIDELARMRRTDLAVRILDIATMDEMLQWSAAKIADFGEALYWAKLTRAFSLGRFLRRVQDGELLAGNSSMAPTPQA